MPLNKEVWLLVYVLCLMAKDLPLTLTIILFTGILCSVLGYSLLLYLILKLGD
jgi:hypothetical protein